jgi:hypothetical protein
MTAVPVHHSRVLSTRERIGDRQVVLWVREDGTQGR